MGFKMTITVNDGSKSQGGQPQPQPNTDRPDERTSRQPLDTV